MFAIANDVNPSAISQVLLQRFPSLFNNSRSLLVENPLHVSGSINDSERRLREGDIREVLHQHLVELAEILVLARDSPLNVLVAQLNKVLSVRLVIRRLSDHRLVNRNLKSIRVKVHKERRHAV